MTKLSITTVALPRLTLEETVAFVARLGYDGLELRVRRVPSAAIGQPYSFWGNHRNDLNPDNFVALAPRIRQLCAEGGAGPAVEDRVVGCHLPVQAAGQSVRT